MKTTVLAAVFFLSTVTAQISFACDSDSCQIKRRGNASWFAPGASTEAVACSESDRIVKALTAATQVELVNMGGSPLTTEVLPKDAHDLYEIRFSYSGIQHTWRVYVDDLTCEVKAVTR